VIGREEWSRPAERTRLVLRFDCPPAELPQAAKTLSQRLEKSGASECSVSVSPGGEIFVEFRPFSKPEETAAMLERVLQRGEMEFLVEATPENLRALGTTLADEQRKFEAWRTAHPNDPLHVFRALAVELGGAAPGVRWCRHRSADGSAGGTAAERPPIALVVPQPKWRFRTADLESLGFTSDDVGSPALSFEVQKARQDDFGDFTESLVGQGLAIVIDDVILALAEVRGRLQGQTRIDGGRKGFTMREVVDMLTLLRSGALPATPIVVSNEKLEPSLNPRAYSAAAVGIVCVLAALAAVFMAVRTLRSRPEPAPADEGWSDARTR
jgi:preprotein translocase subunit SecD